MSGISVTGAWRSVETEWLTYTQTWRGSVFSAFLGPLLYLGAIGFGLGSLVEADGATLSATGEGSPVTYVVFLAPGLVAATAMQVGGAEAIFGTMGRIKWRQQWQTAVSTPLMPGDLALGHVVWTGVRGLVAAVAYALMTVVLGVLDPLQAAATVAPALLAALAFTAPLAAWMVSTPEEHMMNAANRFVLIPMFLFSGVFFPVSQLPDWMEPLARATPLWHGVVLARLAALGQDTPWPLSLHVGYLVALVLLGTVLCVRRFTRRLLA